MPDLKKTTELKFTIDRNLEFRFLGQVDYESSVLLQQDLLEDVKSGKMNIVLGLEHPAVITLGYRADQNDQVILNPTTPVIKSSRGGLATVHSEGQLVIYPLLNLRKLNWSVRDYVELLLKTTKETLNEYSIDSYLDLNNVGVYTPRGKIAFCGVQIKQGVSLHGISINVSNNLDLFNQIVSCGIKNPALDAVQNYVSSPSIEDVFSSWKNKFLNQTFS